MDSLGPVILLTRRIRATPRPRSWLTPGSIFFCPSAIEDPFGQAADPWPTMRTICWSSRPRMPLAIGYGRRMTTASCSPRWSPIPTATAVRGRLRCPGHGRRHRGHGQSRTRRLGDSLDGFEADLTAGQIDGASRNTRMADRPCPARQATTGSSTTCSRYQTQQRPARAAAFGRLHPRPGDPCSDLSARHSRPRSSTASPTPTALAARSRRRSRPSRGRYRRNADGRSSARRPAQ